MVAVSSFSKPSDSLFSWTSVYGCVVSSGTSTWWTVNCPSDLVERIKEAHANNEIVYDVSIASDGDWFFSTSAYNTGKTFDDPSKSRVTKFCQLATKGGHQTNVGNVKWIAFMPGTEGFIGVTRAAVAHLRQSTAEFKVVRSVSAGYNNSWIVVYQDGSSNWSNGIPAALSAKLIAGHGSTLETVILSPKSADEFIASYEDGTSEYVLQAAWMPAVAKQVQALQQNLANMRQMAANAGMISMNQSANYSITGSMNAATNTSYLAAASAAGYGAGWQSLSQEAAFINQASGIY